MGYSAELDLLIFFISFLVGFLATKNIKSLLEKEESVPRTTSVN
jgi:hypothetical protein